MLQFFYEIHTESALRKSCSFNAKRMQLQMSKQEESETFVESVKSLPPGSSNLPLSVDLLQAN